MTYFTSNTFKKAFEKIDTIINNRAMPMPFIFQHVCENKLLEKTRIVEELRQSRNHLNASNILLWEQRDSYLEELRDFHRLRLQDMQNNLEQQQSAYWILVIATVVIVLVLAVVFGFLLATQVKEKEHLVAQNCQYESDIKEKIEHQKTQYENIIEEKANRIQQLEKEQEQDRTIQNEAMATSTVMTQMASPHHPLVYAFSGMPTLAAGSSNVPQVIKA